MGPDSKQRTLLRVPPHGHGQPPAVKKIPDPLRGSCGSPTYNLLDLLGLLFDLDPDGNLRKPDDEHFHQILRVPNDPKRDGDPKRGGKFPNESPVPWLQSGQCPQCRRQSSRGSFPRGTQSRLAGRRATFAGRPMARERTGVSQLFREKTDLEHANTR